MHRAPVAEAAHGCQLAMQRWSNLAAKEHCPRTERPAYLRPPSLLLAHRCRTRASPSFTPRALQGAKRACTSLHPQQRPPVRRHDRQDTVPSGTASELVLAWA